MSIQLDRSVFFPGNVVSGRVHGAMGQTFVSFNCELAQHWVTDREEWYTDHQGHRRSRTVQDHHNRLTPIVNMMIPVNPDGSYQFQLDFGCVPSITVDACTIRYFVKPVVNGQAGGAIPLVILAPMPAAAWQADTSRSAEKSFEVTCCCCCNEGTIAAKFWMNKTAIALDRDQVCVNVDIDASKCEADVENFVVQLNCVGKTKFGQPLPFSSCAGTKTIKADVKAGQTKTVQCIVDLNPMAAPSFKSVVVDVDYEIDCRIVMGLLTGDLEASFPVHVAHSVDMTSFNFQQCWNTTSFYNANQSSPVMYQAPVGQSAFAMAPPQQFQQAAPAPNGQFQ